MQNSIERLAVFPVIEDGEFLFRCSVTNGRNIMILVVHKYSLGMMIRFFTDASIAQAWVEECKAGKHSDE